MNTKYPMDLLAIEVMEDYFNQHGVSCSAAGMAFELHMEFPDSGECHTERCKNFISMKMNELKYESRRYRLDVFTPNIPFGYVMKDQVFVMPRNERMRDLSFSDSMRRVKRETWQSIRDNLTQKLSEAFKGLRYEY